MTHYIKNGSTYQVAADDSLDIHDVLPVGTYTVKFNKMTDSFYLETIQGFELPSKVYGDTERVSDRILNTFHDRSGSTGVLLTGEKGSGKTLQAEYLSVSARESGIPTIVINNPWYGEQFNGFMQTIEQPTVVIFDEFEKVYDSAKQEQVLTLLDGVYKSRKLFVLTCNDKWRIDKHMRNRPGRLFYRLDYTGLDKAFITEYCEDRLNDKSHIEAICQIAVAFSAFNFDILKSLVEEMNRYGDTPHEAIKMLNARPEFSDDAVYDAEFQEAAQEKVQKVRWQGNPLSDKIYLSIEGMNPWDDDTDSTPAFDVSCLKSVDANTGKFFFANDHGQTLSLVKVKASTFQWEAL